MAVHLREISLANASICLVIMKKDPCLLNEHFMGRGAHPPVTAVTAMQAVLKLAPSKDFKKTRHRVPSPLRLSNVRSITRMRDPSH